MAQAHKCDWCGAFYVGERTNQIVIGIMPIYAEDNICRYDICPDCLESFYFWKESRNPNHKSAFEDKEDQ